jgi:5-methylcytosine-specific restriction endonuclease McrA
VLSLLAVTVSLQLTPQNIAIIVAIVIVLLLILGVGGRRRIRRRRAGTAPRRTGTPRRSSGASPRRRDHDLETARKHGTERSPLWPRVEKEHLLHEPSCAACGHRGKGLQVHHIKPFHLHPDLELDPGNLITLCEIKGRDHHLLLGHLDEWESYNVNVREDVKRYYGKSAAAIKADIHWQKAVAKRPS